jgi:hypothetical protein
MRKLLWLFGSLLLLASLLLAACGDEEDDFDPTDLAGINAGNADWIVNITAMQPVRDNNHMIMVTYTGDNTTISASDVVALEINNDPVTWLMQQPGYYHTQVELVPGQSYDMSFSFNGVEKASTSVMIPYACDAALPQSYMPDQAVSIDWTLDGNNQYQVAGVNASKYVSATENYFDEYIKNLPVSSRSLNIPANAVDDFGSGTSYTVFVDQITYKNVNRIAFLGWQGEYQLYRAGSQELSLDRIRAHGRKLVDFLGR